MKRKNDRIKRLAALALAILLLMTAAGTALAETISAIVSSGAATVYADAALSQPLASLNGKTVVRVSDYANGVARISYNGYAGYVRASDLKAVDDVAQKALLNANAKVYQTPSAKSKSVTVKAGTRLYVLLVKDNWAMVEKDGLVGYVGKSFLTKADDNWNVEGTALPTATAAPTVAPTPVPALDSAVSGTVVVDALPVFEAASASATKIGTLKKGQTVNVLKWNGSWALLELNGRYGYAAVKGLMKTSEYEKLTPTPQPTAAPTPTPTPAPTAVPSTDRAIKATVIVDALDAYAEPSIAAEVIGTLKKGREVNALQWNGSWALVELNGRYGYCAVQGLIKSSELATAAPTAVPTAIPTPVPTAAPTATPSLNDAVKATVTVSYLAAYNLPSTKATRLGILRQGQEVNVLKYNSTWAYIELNGRYGYCPVKGLTKTSDLPVATATPAPTAVPDLSNAVPATVTVNSITAYSAASTSAARLGTLTRGQQVNVLAWKDNWALIEMNGRYGYCSVLGLTRNSDLATAAPSPTPTATPALTNAQKATVTVSSLPAYRAASTSAAIVGTLKKGQVVNVIEYNSTWAHVELNGRYGYCAVAGLIKGEALPAATPTPDLSSAVAAQVADGSVTVYRMASTGSAKLGTLYQGREVNVLSVADGWALIELNGYYGFCQASALKKKVPSGFSAGGFTATVIYPGAKAYASASTSAASLSLPLGTSVQVYAYNSDWAVLEKGGSYAFIPVSHVSRTDYDSVSGSGAALQTVLKALLSLGYYDGNPSTTYDAAATTAIKRFQAACGLNETGVADTVTQRILYGGHAPKDGILSALLSKGSTGTSVTRMQTRLFALGYLSKSGSLDGDYGNTTASAVKLFQSANGLTASGSANAETLKALYSTGAKSLPSGSKAADVTTSTSSGSSGGSTYSDSVPAGLVSTVTSYNASMSTAEKLEYIVYLTQSKLGRPYVYGASGPDKFDCSGLTYYVYKQIGITLKRSAYSQGYDSNYQMVENISDLQRGDLVYFNTISDSDLSDHAGVYIGNGYFIHAPHTGTNVSVSYLYSGYYSRAFSWGRRILG